MLIDSGFIVLGLVGLIWGADLFIIGASAIARGLGVSPLLIGLTIVAFGTSSPEIFSSAVSALNDKPELAIGNAIGSNLFNVGVALGAAALARPLMPPPCLSRKELPALLLVTFTAGLLLLDYNWKLLRNLPDLLQSGNIPADTMAVLHYLADGFYYHLGRGDSLMLMALIAYLGYRLFRSQRDEPPPEAEKELRSVPVLKWAIYGLLGLSAGPDQMPGTAQPRVTVLGPHMHYRLANLSDHSKSQLMSVIYLLLGLLLLVLSAEVLVFAASNIAGELGVSTAIIGLTIVALGTSLPELAASVTCALRGHHDLAIGNIVGSNIFNLLAVLPFPGLFSPGEVEAQLVERDFPAMLLLTLLLAGFCFRGIRRGRPIGRFAGLVFLSIYGIWFMVMLSQAHT